MKNQSSNAIMLDVVRKIRSYMSVLDAAHLAAETAKDINDPAITTEAQTLQSSIEALNTNISRFLKTLEGSRIYKDMVLSYNIDDNDDE